MARRRVVTGHDAEGRSVVVGDGPTSGRFDSGEWEELWAFEGVPADLADPTDPAALQRFRLVPAPGRIACRLFTIPARDGSPRGAEEREWEQRIDWAEVERLPPPADPRMHRTPTVDVVVVVSGEMDLVLDGGEEVRLRPGDSVVQRGTMHAWRNPGPGPCVAVAFMVRAE